MATKLQCEICGGKLIGKPGGIFECDSCGTEYSTEWAKAKIQEIQGTVKVEGTVEVKGSVQVEGAANVQSLIKRGYLALEDRKWDEAEKCFNDALNADPENAEAYLGLGMSKAKCQNKEVLTTKYCNDYLSRIRCEKELKRAKQFGDEDLKQWIDSVEKEYQNNYKQEQKRKKQDQAKIDANQRSLKEGMERARKYQKFISAGMCHTVGLKDNGTVVAVGHNKSNDSVDKKRKGECEVSSWTDIVEVAAGGLHTVGLKSNGKVVAAGTNIPPFMMYNRGDSTGICDVSNWRDITAIAAGSDHTVGIKKDGTVVATGNNQSLQCLVTDKFGTALWKNIKAIAAGGAHTVGLREGGRVSTTGKKEYYSEWRKRAGDWDSIVALAAGLKHTVGLKSNGRVVALGENKNGQCNVSDWTDIIAISAGSEHTVGLKNDGTVVATSFIKSEFASYKGQCNVSGWKDIIAIAAGSEHTVGLKADGTVVAVGNNSDAQCNVSGWKLFKTDAEKESDYSNACKWQESGTTDEIKKAFDIFKELKDYKDSAEREKACSVKLLNAEKATLQTELPNLKGIFSAKRRKEINTRLAQIEDELKRL